MVQNNFFFLDNFSNIYKKPSKKSEVVSQILYGEKFKILSKSKNWIKIKNPSAKPNKAILNSSTAADVATPLRFLAVGFGGDG